jgi:hypothetical protein
MGTPLRVGRTDVQQTVSLRSSHSWIMHTQTSSAALTSPAPKPRRHNPCRVADALVERDGFAREPRHDRRLHRPILANVQRRHLVLAALSHDLSFASLREVGGASVARTSEATSGIGVWCCAACERRAAYARCAPHHIPTRNHIPEQA